MRGFPIVAVFLAACGLVFASPIPDPGGAPPVHPVIVPPGDDPGGGGGVVPATFDADLDGFVVAVDCNDGDATVNPTAVEKTNGIDDNCDGVVDDGFDTTIDWPQVELSTVLWPTPGITKVGEIIATEAQPRLVWAGDRFMAVWIDVRSRLRVARIGSDATLLATPDYLRKPVLSADAAWSGTRLGIVYEDNLTRTPSVRLMLLDRGGLVEADVLIAAVGSEPKIAWGQDRFGVVFKVPGSVNVLRFQQFDPEGVPLSPAEVLVNSGGRAAVAFSGTTVARLDDDRFNVGEGMFGIVYEAYYGVAASGDVLLSAFPREAGRVAPIGPVRVNQHDDPFSSLGAMPTIAGNASGFAVGWHVSENGLDRAQARFFSLGGLAPVQEFTPDLDAARYGHMTWTGGEFVMVNDNRTGGAVPGFDVHLRRFDPSGNTHVDAGWGPWSELNLRSTVRGAVSSHPDVANAGPMLGVLWVEGDPASACAVGRLWFATIVHK